MEKAPVVGETVEVPIGEPTAKRLSYDVVSEGGQPYISVDMPGVEGVPICCLRDVAQEIMKALHVNRITKAGGFFEKNP